MPPVIASAFPAFFQAIHGYPPFPWQERLLNQVLLMGWPKTISLPTASGKTAVLDIAIFALACQALVPPVQRTAPRRIALVVDRRIVVDDAFRRASLIAARISSATQGILAQVRQALIDCGGEDHEPLATAVLRGGIYREDRWARSPAQPVLMCSTVDQVGSRLLFRGYGISSRAAPIHAGLLGNDTLIILDEAHCSEPFRQTLASLARYRAKAERSFTAPFQVVNMTATPRSDDPPFTLEPIDRAHAVLSARINAQKDLQLLPLNNGLKDKQVAAEVCQAIVPHAQPGKFILVVVNRVATARVVVEELARVKELREYPRLLLTGRARSIDRDRLIVEHQTRIMAGRDRDNQTAAPPLLVVATQCVEVGADLDADVLITECCPIDSLRQRLGRLDRLGQIQKTTAVVFCREPWDGSKEPPIDPIYGQALARTWHWLNTAQVTDGGICALDQKLAGITNINDLRAPVLDAPHIFPAYVDLWAQTGPEPAVSPEPAIFLHGPTQGEPDVQFVWRADLGDNPDLWADIVALTPPVTGETLAVPLSAARRWLSGERGTEVADMPVATEDESETKDVASFAPTLRWRGPEDSSVARSPNDLRPGDVLVVPCKRGGCDEFGWNPLAKNPEPVTDRADVARAAARRAPVVRLVAGAWPCLDTLPSPATWTEDQWPEDRHAVEAQIGAALATLPANDPGRTLLDGLHLRPGTTWIPHPGGAGLVVVGRAGWSLDANDLPDEDDASSQAPVVQLLDDHQKAVEKWIRWMATTAGLPDELIQDLALAGRCHDLGKADPRFQALLRGGNRLGQPLQVLLAKSAGILTGAAANRARERSQYPRGARHELVSVKLLESDQGLLAQAQDPELVLHLVASHHGRCRPWAPVVIEIEPVTVSLDLDGRTLKTSSNTDLQKLDSGVAERFWLLNNRYGRWGLAYLEALVRLADHRASAEVETVRKDLP